MKQPVSHGWTRTKANYRLHDGSPTLSRSYLRFGWLSCRHTRRGLNAATGQLPHCIIFGRRTSGRRYAILEGVSKERGQDLSLPASLEKLSQINKKKLLGFGPDLAEDHPGFGDQEYIDRRIAIAQLAYEHGEGQPVPRLEYLPKEKKCWGLVLHELRELYKTHACQEFLQNIDKYDFREDTVPQLEDISQILRQATGWRIHPVAGLLHPREFLNGLAFKIFHSTQYMRHHSQPMYTPEPDICHELLGHTVMLSDPHYADLVQTIGIASLGADEKQIWHLTKVYWFTVEFGVVREGDEIKAFGAGLLSSYGELQHMRHGNPQLWPFDPFQKQPKMSYKEGYQKGYFVLNSFKEGAQQLQEYCRAITPSEVLEQFSLSCSGVRQEGIQDS